MFSDVCGWTLLRRGCDLQLTFKILQLEEVFFRCSSLSHHRSVDICVHTSMTMKRWCDSTMKWQCNDDGAMARWKKVRCCGVAIAITRWSDSDYTEGDIEEMILHHIIVSFHCAIVVAPSLYWLSLKWITIPAAIAQHGVWWLSNAIASFRQ